MIRFCNASGRCDHKLYYEWSNKQCIRCRYKEKGCSLSITEESKLYEQRIGQCEKCDNRYKCWTE